MFGDAATSAVNTVGQSIWNFSMTLLTGAFKWIDHFGRPDVTPTGGALTGVLPTTMWLGAVIAALVGAALLGVVGALQLDVLKERLQAEYGLPITRFDLADTAAAHDAVENGVVGKVLIDVAG